MVRSCRLPRELAPICAAESAESADQGDGDLENASLFWKQVSLILPVGDFRRVRLEAARRGLKMNVLIRHWIEPQLEALKTHPTPRDGGDAARPGKEAAQCRTSAPR